MSEDRPFTVESFYRFISEGKLMAARCQDCGKLLLPPKPMCTSCLSVNLQWTELERVGKLLSYTVIHIAPEQFQSLAPYSVGIVELKSGLRLPGMIKEVEPEKLKVGMKLELGFDTGVCKQWPGWRRYYFHLI